MHERASERVACVGERRGVGAFHIVAHVRCLLLDIFATF